MRVGPQVGEIHRYVKGMRANDSGAATRQNLAEVSLSSAEALFPFQISGGMGQRAAIAMAHAADTELLIADEPTKGLDAELRDSVAARLKHEVDTGRLLLTITHDVAVARALGGTIGVMLDGRLAEYGPAETLLDAPEHAYTEALLAADPSQWERRIRPTLGKAVIAARGLEKRYGDKVLFSGFDLEVAAGEIVSIVGPSGCGKTTIGNILLGLTKPDAGAIECRLCASRSLSGPACRLRTPSDDPPRVERSGPSAWQRQDGGRGTVQAHAVAGNAVRSHAGAGFGW
jgi:peptide/nickel transport system ATP-binding protein